MIEIADLFKVYRTETVETTALNGVNLSVNEGEFVSIMGASGCGKSTLLNIIGLLDTPTKGEYLLDGKKVGDLSAKERSAIRRNKIGFVFQNFNLIDELTVSENVELPLLYTRVPSAKRKDKVKSLLESMNIQNRADHYPQQLSGGQQQRVAVARALANDPRLILADEPTGNLDSTNGSEVMQILSELNAAGTTILMVTHSSFCADFGNRIIRILDGKIVSENVSKVAMPI